MDKIAGLPSKVRVELMDVMTILYHVHMGTQNPAVGFEDCDRTLAKLTEELATKPTTLVSLSALESGLWSCNLMAEDLKFWSPRGESFDSFVRRLLRRSGAFPPLTFDKVYNLIKKSNKSGT